ncbi:hypothetical protein K491DRAFT_696837 [Lophiostoma macrostomum CBS 122681]|uniref:Uncharacterized protein n=1 Tax=Lophiostoma macrostomum CBS 122681 TaxID=1314788 RepID=A0A6A6SXL1_9PLEO|nr:hypothetical protein K491DRAFT_696837 [Lophiostoma macrostomum CBS 122681]
MSSNEKNGGLPTYEDSIHSGPSQTPHLERLQPNRAHSPSRGQQILDRLTIVRSQQIREVIENHVIPTVERQASYGIAQTTIAIIPSDVPLQAPEPEKSEFSFDIASTKQVEVIGFSSNEEPLIVRLEGQKNRTEFWRPQANIDELERVLQDSLNTSPYLKPPSPVHKTPPAPARPVRRSIFGRIVDAVNQEERSPSGKPEVGTRAIAAGRQVLARARLEEICLRTVNEFGLYDTMSKQCIIIRVDARC